MIYIRSFLYLFGQIISAIVVCLVVLPLAFLPSLQRARLIASWAKFNIWSLRVLCGITYQVSGKAHITETPGIIISNHQSAWETLALQLIFPAQSYLLKRELLRIPFFGWGLALNRPIAIDRSKKTKALDQLIKQGIERLQEGRWLVIFPEGTRMNPGDMGSFQVGGAMMAAKSGYPVFPVAHNAGVFWPRHSFLKYPGKIELVIGAPIETKGKKARTINTEVEQWIVAQTNALPLSR